MKFTNIKQLIIKFMGGGLINFPTRFLRWVKINGDIEDGGGGGDSESSNVFFSPAVIQPTHIGVRGDDDTSSIIEIKDFTLSSDGDSGGTLIYSKDDLVNIGINENDLNNLEIVSVDEIMEDANGTKGLTSNSIANILNENYIIAYINCNYDGCEMARIIRENNIIPIIYRLGDNLYVFSTIQGVQ